HVLLAIVVKTWMAGHQGVHARLRRAMPGHDGRWRAFRAINPPYVCSNRHETSSARVGEYGDSVRSSFPNRYRELCIGVVCKIKEADRVSQIAHQSEGD